jgi:hypothetical protein
MLFWGSVPALLLGLLYGVLVKVTLKRKLQRQPEASINQQAL